MKHLKKVEQHRRLRFHLMLVLIAVLIGCANPKQSSSDLPQVPNSPASNAPVVDTSSSVKNPLPLTAALPTNAPTISTAPQILKHSLPDTQVIADVPLLYQPDSLAIAPNKIPRGATVILLGRDESQAWYRVYWEGYFGWIPTKVTDFPPSKAIESRAPPPCAKPRSYRRGLDSEWNSSSEGQVAVVIDLYRSTFGDEFPRSTLQIKVNGVAVQGKERMISSKGEFLTRGAVIPVGVKKQDRIGFQLLTPSSEQVKLFATIFSVPDGCSFKE